MKKLIVVADDFGWTESINNGTADAFENGIITELSLSIDFPATEHAISYIKNKNVKDVGIHMVLKGPLSNNGKKLGLKDYKNMFQNETDETIKKLALDELKRFENLVGFKPTHIIPQYGIHGNLKLLKIIIEFAEKHDIPIRIPITALAEDNLGENYAAEIMLKRSKVRQTDKLFEHVLGSNYDKIKNTIIEEIKDLENNETAELLIHPGYVDKDLINITSLRFERSRDIALCKDKDIQNTIKKNNIKLASFHEL